MVALILKSVNKKGSPKIKTDKLTKIQEHADAISFAVTGRVIAIQGTLLMKH